MAHILVIDDDASIRSLLREAFEEAGYKVSESSDGYLEPHGWDEPADMVITDMCLGEISGLDVIRSLRLLRSSVRIIAMSGGSKDQGLDILQEAEREGADAWIAKPFKIETVLTTVQALLATSMESYVSQSGRAAAQAQA
jgi:DNA-binding response OmpR family regulator